MGSKNRLANELIEIMQPYKYDFYVEPFVGGANLIDKIEGPKRFGIDSNKYLIALLQKLQTDWKMPYLSKEEYNDIKNNKESFPDYLVGYAGVLCSYCGVWFGSYAGRLDRVNRDYQLEAHRNVNKQRSLLEGITFICGDYKDYVFKGNTLVYCDPPYAGTSKYLNSFDSDIFWDWAFAQRVDLFVSEYQAPNTFYKVWEKEVKSSLSINKKRAESKKSTEKLFRRKAC